MQRKRVVTTIAIILIMIITGIVVGLYLIYGCPVILEKSMVEVNGQVLNSSQPLGDILGVFNHEVESISLSGNLELAVFTETDGFSLLTAEQGNVMMNVDGLTQLFLCNEDSVNGEITR